MSVQYAHRFLTDEEREIVKKEEKHGGIPEHGMFEFREPELDWPPEVIREKVCLGGVDGVCVKSADGGKKAALVHIHGGGFFGGSPVTGFRLMLAMKQRFGIDSFSVDYTRTPHKRAPEQIRECAAFCQAVQKLGYEKLLLAGESAGGNLVICTTLYLKDQGLPLPAAVAASSPVTDMTGLIEKPEKDMFSESSGELAESYVGDYEANSPYVSPIYGDFTGFPPLLLQAGTTESLRYDSLYLAKMLEETDCDCTVSVWEGAPHAIGIDVLDTWYSRNCMEQIVRFFGEKAELDQKE